MREATTRTAGLDNTVVGSVEIADIRCAIDFVSVPDGRGDRDGDSDSDRGPSSRERTVIPEVPVEIEDAELVGLCDVQECAKGCVGVYRLPVHQAIVSGVVAQAIANFVGGHLGARGATQESREGVGNRDGRPIRTVPGRKGGGTKRHRKEGVGIERQDANQEPVHGCFNFLERTKGVTIRSPR